MGKFPQNRAFVLKLEKKIIDKIEKRLKLMRWADYPDPPYAIIWDMDPVGSFIQDPDPLKQIFLDPYP
uniref:Uncharacterized protein n=1 Tax=Romanomermis culicivorax TaxID=13658 RepID=A0A915HGP1_ROMCU